MEIDQNTFFNLVLEKTGNKMNELQAKVITLEAQLQLAVEVNNKLKVELSKINKKEKKSEFTN